MSTPQTISTRIPDDILEQLPPPSLTGERSKFVLDAIKEKLERDKA